MMEFFKFVVGFFKPWRRKVGCATLVLACLLMIGWVRSLRISDTFVLTRAGNTTQFQVISKNGNLALRKFESDLPLKLLNGRMANSVTYQKQIPGTDVSLWYTSVFGEGKYRMQYYLCGFAFGEIYLQDGPVRGTVRIAAYWSVILPLTFISACLLITRPRNSNQNKTAQPITNEGGATT